MMSRSGVLVLPDNDAAPPLCDIALSLSRMPRFAGHTVDPWSVAEHSMVVALIARYSSDAAAGSRQEMYGLVHDMQESVTTDIPSTWKTSEMRAMQEQLDERIYVTLGITPPDSSMQRFIKGCDQAALLAEAKLLTTPAQYDAIRGGLGWNGKPRSEANPTALIAVGDIKSYGFTQEAAAAHFLAWAKRLLTTWRTA